MLEAEVPEWVQGALICLFGSTLTALGLVLQKHSHTVLESSGGDESNYFLQKWWLLGFVVFISAQIINMVAMAMTPQVVLSCLGSWTLVCNAVFARLILSETLSFAQVLAVIGLVVAMALIVYNAPRPEGSGSGGDAVVLAGRFLSPDVEALTALFLGLICLARSFATKRASANDSSMGEEEEEEGEKQMLLPLSFAMMAAVSAGYTALFFKCIAEIIAGAVASAERGSPPWYCWETYAIAAAALSCAPTELHCLNLALQSGEAIFVIPVYLTLGMMAQLTTGAVFFQEFSDFRSDSNTIGFGLGVLLTLVFVVAMAKAQSDHYEKLAEEEEISVPDLFVKMASDVDDNAARSRPPARSDFLVRYVPTASENQLVTVAGFGGAIAYLESRRLRGKSEFFHGLPARRTLAAPSTPPVDRRIDRASTSPV